MKKLRLKNLIAIAFVFLLAILILPLSPQIEARADSYYGSSSAHAFEVVNYDVIANVGADRVVHFNETITVKYLGYDSTGIYRDIPINAGDKVYNVNVTFSDGSPVTYFVEMQDVEFLTLSIGDYSNKTGESETYLITYDYHITRPVKENDLYLNIIGFGWDATIKDVDITLNLPYGLASAKYYLGRYGQHHAITPQNNKITLHVDSLPKYSGVTFNLYFNSGVLHSYFDFTQILFLLISLGAVALFTLLIFYKRDKSVVIPVVNFTAPDEMDPLAMGKIIDNNVNQNDVTSMIYYWASKGYVNLNFENEHDPVIIKVSGLPADAPNYEQNLFNGMFRNGDVVATSSLVNKFYMTTEAVTMQVNATYSGKLYDNKSRVFAIGASFVSGLVGALVPLLICLAKISWKFFFWPVFFALVPTIAVYALSEYTYFHEHKFSESKKKLLKIGAYALGGALSLIYALIVPEFIDFWLLFTSAVCGFLPVPSLVKIICKTPDYVAKLNQIVGFKNFILYAEKDRLEKMVADNPQLYYGILPYAQVLGVSDVWEEKFAKITIAPPAWLRGHYSTWDYIYINRMIRTSRYVMSSSMISRPSSSGSSGSGGFGGGGGGGHGGGGGRGR